MFGCRLRMKNHSFYILTFSSYVDVLSRTVTISLWTYLLQSLLQGVMDRGSGNFHYWSLFIIYLTMCQSNQFYNDSSYSWSVTLIIKFTQKVLHLCQEHHNAVYHRHYLLGWHVWKHVRDRVSKITSKGRFNKVK